MIVLIGKTASGKSTILSELIKEGFTKIITDTTRPMRSSEVNGIDYNFISKDEFADNIKNGLYAEHVVYDASFGRVSYGSKKESYSNSEENTIIILNPYGLKMVIEQMPDLSFTSIYLKANENTLRERLLKRGDAKEEIERRLLTDKIDFEGMEDLCNFTLETDSYTIDELKKIIKKII